MAGKKASAIVQPAKLSEQYIVDSSDDDVNENGAEIMAKPGPTNRSQKIANRLDDKKEESQPDSESDEDPDDEKSSGDDEDDEDTEDEEEEARRSPSAQPKSGPEKRGSGSDEAGNERPSKKAKPASQTPLAIPAQRFSPPKGFEKILLSASERASPAFLSKSEAPQVWYITAPASVSIESIGDLDLDAALKGQPIVQQGGSSYQFIPSERATETLLLAEGQDCQYQPQPATISRIFHLRHSALPKAGSAPLSPSNPAKLNFTATRRGERKAVREQPNGLQMRYQPFGSGALSDQPSSQASKKSRLRAPSSDKPVEMAREIPRSAKTQDANMKEATGLEMVDGSSTPSAKSRSTASKEVKSHQVEHSPTSEAAAEGKEKRRKKKKKARLVDEVF